MTTCAGSLCAHTPQALMAMAWHQAGLSSLSFPATCMKGSFESDRPACAHAAYLRSLTQLLTLYW